MKLLRKRLNALLEEKGLITNIQAGFRSGISAIDQLMWRATDAQVLLSNGIQVAAIFMDLSNLFVTVWNCINYNQYNYQTTVTRWISSFLNGKTTKIKIGEPSESVEIK